MPVKRRRAPRWLIVALALPVFVAVYVAVAGRRLLSIGRGFVVGFLAVTVIGSVYAEVAARTAAELTPILAMTRADRPGRHRPEAFRSARSAP